LFYIDDTMNYISISLQHPAYNLVHFYVMCMKWVYILFVISAHYAI